MARVSSASWTRTAHIPSPAVVTLASSARRTRTAVTERTAVATLAKIVTPAVRRAMAAAAATVEPAFPERI